MESNYNAINNELSEVNWDAVVSSGSVDDRWVRFRDLLHGLIWSHVPLYDEIRKKKAKTISKQATGQIKARNVSWSDYGQCPSADKFSRYKQILNRVNKIVRVDKAELVNKMLQFFKGRQKSVMPIY